MDTNHDTAVPTTENLNRWIGEVKNQVIGKTFRDRMRMGWNTGLADLMEVPSTAGEPAYAAASTASTTSTTSVDFSFGGKRPSCQGDVVKMLFDEQMGGMIKEGRYAEVFAVVFKWCYYLTMEGCSSSWATVATENYIKSRNFRVSLGTTSAMKEGCTNSRGKMLGSKTHSWIRIGRKMASNSFIEGIRKKQERTWGVKLLTLKRISDTDDAQSGKRDVIDIGPYLPARVRREMTRKDGTMFLIEFKEEKANTPELALKWRLSSVIEWCNETGVSEEDAVAMLRSLWLGNKVRAVAGGGKARGTTRVGDATEATMAPGRGGGGTKEKSGGGDKVGSPRRSPRKSLDGNMEGMYSPRGRARVAAEGVVAEKLAALDEFLKEDSDDEVSLLSVKLYAVVF